MDELASQLNISNTMEDKAVRAYTTIGEWLEGNAEGEDVVVYPQGSFGLGTVVRPYPEQTMTMISIWFANFPACMAPPPVLLKGSPAVSD